MTFPHVSLTSNGTPIPERQLMFRKCILWLHRWTGLAITAFIIVMAVTGTILAFHTELDRMLNPALMTVPVRDAPLLDAVALRLGVRTNFLHNQAAPLFPSRPSVNVTFLLSAYQFRPGTLACEAVPVRQPRCDSPT